MGSKRAITSVLRGRYVERTQPHTDTGRLIQAETTASIIIRCTRDRQNFIRLLEEPPMEETTWSASSVEISGTINTPGVLRTAPQKRLPSRRGVNPLALVDGKGGGDCQKPSPL